MDTFDKKLNKHIDKMLEIQRKQDDKALTLEELKEIDMSLGISEKEWEAMMQKAEKSAELAQSHFNYGNFREAYSTAETAVSINPYQTKAHIVMAESALKIYLTEDDDDFREAAEQHAREVLKQSPNNRQAIQLLAKLNKLKTSSVAKRKKYLHYGIAFVSVAVIITAIVIWQSSKPETVDEDLKYQMIEAEENANAAWAQVENMIARRNQLLPQLFDAVNTDDKEIAQLKTDIETLRNQIENTDEEKQIRLQAELQTKIKELTSVIAEKTDDGQTQMLMVQIEGAYNRIATEGRRYNDVAKQYNILVKKHGDKLPQFKLKPYFKGN